ncbi:MAG: DUF1269 domain-containing protein [Pseudomonadota bacterium]|nr:DUF1269 domain-containing protein [Pseudomonadota bacterium]
MQTKEEPNAKPKSATLQGARLHLLLARVEERHIHFLAKRGTPMDGLHEANVLQKTDVVHGAQLGLVIGALLGCAAGGLLVFLGLTAERWQIATVIGTTFLGALLGTWVSSMVGSAIPNSRLQQFDALIDQGCILLMIDVPEDKVEEIKKLLRERHPEAQDRGLDPHIPVFP